MPHTTPSAPSPPVGKVASALLLALVVAMLPTGARGQTALAAGDLPPSRIAGADRVETSAALVRRWADAGGQTDVAVIVPADRTDVALATAGLAGRLGGVTVLSSNPPRPSSVDAVRAAGATAVVVVGGDGALEEAWEQAGLPAEPLAAQAMAPDRGAPALAAAVARALAEDGAGGARAYLAGTGGLPDALAAGPLAYAAAVPLLLTAAEALDPNAAEVIEQTGITAVTVLGGTAVVSDAVVAQLQVMGVAVDRVAGADREQTALALQAIARSAAAADPVLLADGVLLAAGDDPADAASAAALAALSGQAILPPGEQVRAALADRCGAVGALTVLGGVAAVPTAVEDVHRASAQRCDGVRAPLLVRVAIAVPSAPEQVPGVLAMVTAAEGWASRRVRFVAADAAPQLGILIGDAGVCGGAAVCRRGETFAVDGGRWAVADSNRRQRIVSHVIGSWLGEPVNAGCLGGVMDPLDCADSTAVVDPARRDAVADRFVPTATLAFAGDVHAERHIATGLAQGRNPLAPVAAHLSAADLAILNLETPLSVRGTPAAKTFVFRGPPAMAGALADAGVDIVSLANNHALDYGVDALLDTLEHTAAAGVEVVGAGPDAARAYAPVIRETPAGTVAVIGLTRVLHTRTWEATATRPGLASAYDEAAALAAVAQARSVADHVVVAIHWGIERADCPDPTQRRLAVLLTDAGADLVIGHHPHVLQGVQVRGDALIAYSLGNFVWYHNSAPSRFTGILDVELPLLDDPSWSFTPAEIGTDGSPHLAGGSLGDAITRRLTDRSPSGPIGCGFP